MLELRHHCKPLFPECFYVLNLGGETYQNINGSYHPPASSGLRHWMHFGTLEGLEGHQRAWCADRLGDCWHHGSTGKYKDRNCCFTRNFLNASLEP